MSSANSEAPRLSRSLPGMPPAAPVRIVHVGLGNFHRAHQAYYTCHAADAAQWGGSPPSAVGIVTRPTRWPRRTASTP